MRIKKVPSRDDVCKIGVALSSQLEASMVAWAVAMSCYRIDSAEYKSICRAGKLAQEAYLKMDMVASGMLSDEEKDKYFTIKVRCGFN